MIPQNELGVIVLFAQQAREAGFEIVSIQPSFPDAIVEKDGQTYRVEFEYQAASFVAHKHDVRGCDLIVCWQNDYLDSILPILALADDWQFIPLELPTEAEREAAYWKQRALQAENEIKQLQAKTAPIPVQTGSRLSEELRTQLDRLGETTKQVFNMLLVYGVQTQAQLAQKLGITRQAVSYHVHRLEDLELAGRNDKGVEVLVDLGNNGANQ